MGALEGQVLGYYALAMGSVRHGDAPSRPRREQPDPVPVLLLAKLALHRQEQGTGLGADPLRYGSSGPSQERVSSGHAPSWWMPSTTERSASISFTGFLPFLGNQRLYRRIGDLERSLAT